MLSHLLLLQSSVGGTKLHLVLTWSFAVPLSIFSTPLYQSYFLHSVCLGMLAVCVLTQTAALLTCVGCICVWKVGVEKEGPLAFCVFLPGEQTASQMCGNACCVRGFIDLSLVLQ